MIKGTVSSQPARQSDNLRVFSDFQHMGAHMSPLWIKRNMREYTDYQYNELL